ncbi:RNA polymerase sigma-70 factor, ECF subfamily [Amycolatopsis tolypomycina]|uniref:RNA polymerase sigma-70 factor, ECF subfamily n=1 Tax=Amycolatopsis tolypomycina TaxID=208445 RepID=A0A1H4JGW0_9PSEU|nr:sigma-70 family RNA polymerase sigma factor [Amycolatopsis tolypomycina]SEB45599.1 RNA polymerase sigma-70 factor, ECF subfamily [Amycolatopsis tolypomycina]
MFYREDLPRLISFLLKLGHAGGVAQDAAQQAMISALERWDGIQSPAAWVRKVATRLAVAATEREQERIRRHVRAGHEQPQQAPDPYAELEARMELDWLLRLLSPRQREVMAWTFDGFSPSEIAEELKIPTDTVRSNLRHARTHLKSIYDRRKGELRG